MLDCVWCRPSAPSLYQPIVVCKFTWNRYENRYRIDRLSEFVHQYFRLFRVFRLKFVQNFKTSIFLFMVGCIAATALAAALLGRVDVAELQGWLRSTGVWAPIFYILLYAIATVLILPSTPLNLLGGALFGPWLGILWTSVAAMIAAIATFAFTRTIGRKAIARKLSERWQTGRWQTLDAEIRQGGLFYMVAIRLVPFMPYGLLNFAAGLTSVSYRDYLLGTLLGTTPGILPYVLLGSSGLRAVQTGDRLPLVGALALTGLLIGGSTWYRRRRSRRRSLSAASLPPDASSESLDPQDR